MWQEDGVESDEPSNAVNAKPQPGAYLHALTGSVWDDVICRLVRDNDAFNLGELSFLEHA